MSAVEISQACKPAVTESHCASDLPVLPNIPLGEKHDVNHFLSMSFCRLHAQWISRLKTQDSALTCKRCLQLARSMEQGTCFHPVECILAVQDSQSQSCFHRSMLYFRDICLRASNVSQMRQNHRKQNQVSPEAHHIENHHIENQNESEAKKDRALQQADHVVVKRASGCAPGKVCIGQHALGKGGWTPVMLITANDTCNRKVFSIYT